MPIVRFGQSEADAADLQGGGGDAGLASGGGSATGPAPSKFSPKCGERELAALIGLPQRKVAQIRRLKLEVGVDFEKLGRPAKVWYSDAGVERVRGLVGVVSAVPVVSGLPPVPEVSPVLVDPPVLGHRIPDDQIARLPQNGLILEHGRPGWWTEDEAVVVANSFANRKAILVEFEGRQVICRVKDATNFVPRMVIPVRRYENIVLAARQPRWPGKW